MLIERIDNVITVLICATGIVAHILYIVRSKKPFKWLKGYAIVALFFVGVTQFVRLLADQLMIDNHWYQAAVMAAAIALMANGIANPWRSAPPEGSSDDGHRGIDREDGAGGEPAVGGADGTKH